MLPAFLAEMGFVQTVEPPLATDLKLKKILSLFLEKGMDDSSLHKFTIIMQISLTYSLQSDSIRTGSLTRHSCTLYCFLFLLIGDMPLRNLSKIPNIMLEIEHILNDPKDESLWRLAESFKTGDGVDIDVEMFRHRGTDANPTYHLMEYIIARFPEEQTIQDLIKHLLNISRRDCLGIIAEYLEGRCNYNSKPLVF